MSATTRSPFGRGFDAFLFDMDGTILTSIVAAERVWSDWARRHGLDVARFLPTIHGVQSVETIRRLGLPGVDPEHEAALITEAEMADCLGFEDAPAGIEAAERAGATVVLITATHTHPTRLTHHAVAGYDGFRTREDRAGRLELVTPGGA